MTHRHVTPKREIGARASDGSPSNLLGALIRYSRKPVNVGLGKSADTVRVADKVVGPKNRHELPLQCLITHANHLTVTLVVFSASRQLLGRHRRGDHDFRALRKATVVDNHVDGRISPHPRIEANNMRANYAACLGSAAQLEDGKTAAARRFLEGHVIESTPLGVPMLWVDETDVPHISSETLRSAVLISRNVL